VRYIPVPYPVPSAGNLTVLPSFPADSVSALAPLGTVGTPLAPSTSPDIAALSDTTGQAERPAVVVARVREVERALLETGLFRAVGVNFEFAESTLLDGTSALIDPVGDVLRRFPFLQIEIVGHTDSVGGEAFNQRLSEARAQTVRRYLIDVWAIDAGRLGASGRGEAEPFVTNDNPTGRALNRRVEFRVVEGG
jgi:outer membrane protein OmpA-like peptidoglycan-associated protein